MKIRINILSDRINHSTSKSSSLNNFKNDLIGWIGSIRTKIKSKIRINNLHVFLQRPQGRLQDPQLR